MYGDISVENTLKLLIRCKILFATRMSLIDLFDTIYRLKAQESEVLEYKDDEGIIYNEQADNEDDGSQPQQPPLAQALSMNSQYTAIAEELIAKVKILTGGQHKSLKN